MNKNNRNNEQIYGRNDMIMLDQNNKIYGSLGLADRYVMKTEEGTRLMLSNPKLGRFDDVLTEFNIYGMSKQERTTGAQLLDIKSGSGAGVIASTQHDGYVITAQGVYAEGDNSAYRNVGIKLDTAKVVGKIITASVESAENDAGETLSMICDINYLKPDGAISWNSFGMNKPITVSIPADAKLVRCRIHIIEENEKTIGYGTYTTTVKGLMVSIGDKVIPWEPYTGGQPSPSPDYPQEIKSVVNPIVKVTNEDGLKVQSVTLNNITLNAIPVKSGGNVTINGQQYIADYVDIEKGKLYRKVTRLNLKDVDATNIAHGFHSNGNGYLSFSVKNVSKEHQPISNRYKSSNWTQTSGYMYIPNSNTIVCVDDRFTDKQTAIKLVQDTYVIYALSSPTEEDLSLEQIKSIKSLSTYYPVTIVENNYNTWMKATYKSTESV